MNIRDIKLAALRRNIGVVLQESLLLNRSVADNLRVGKADATEAEMRDAAERAQALDFIERAPDTFSNAGRANAAARCRAASASASRSPARILKDPPILILDEATSALDAETERKVQAALDEVMKNRTTFVIAHRLSTVRNATRILVFETRPHHRDRHLRRTRPHRRPLRGARQGAVHDGGDAGAATNVAAGRDLVWPNHCALMFAARTRRPNSSYCLRRSAPKSAPHTAAG